jgi:serine/threonine protein kinase/Tfp pilus assembly protein PilF
MNPELYRRLKPLYEAALETPLPHRAQFISQACGEDLELKLELDALLAQNDQGAHTLDLPILDFHSAGGFRQPAFRKGDLLLSRFRIVRLLGFGGMGEVYEAEDDRLQGVHIALKTILPHIASDPDLQKRFEREVLLTRQVIHPNLCPIYDIFHSGEPTPGLLFLTMKLLPGQTLAARIRQPEPIPAADGIEILKQVALGLAAIHAAGIVHRDIKPNNIIFDGGGPDLHLWITDFGLARAYHTEPTVSGKSILAGTPAYIAPELFRGHMPSQASDLFAFGVVLHEVFSGEKPTPISNSTSYAVSPRLASRKIPLPYIELVKDCLDQDPGRRCQAFEAALKTIDPKVDRRQYKEQVESFWTRRRFIGATAAGACAIAAGAWWKWDNLEDRLHPLPQKRSVALMAWPNSESSAVVSTVLNSIGERLARAEAYVKDLLIITVSDLPRDSPAPTTPTETVGAMGANLVLAASLQSTPSRHWLTLQILDAATQRLLRKTRVSAQFSELSSMAEKASEAAARLLDLPANKTPLKDTEELRGVSPEVFRAYSEAEQLVNQPNDTGLEGAIVKYQQALELDPRFALGYARLAMAYVEQYLTIAEPPTLRLARSNATLAVRYNPGSAKGLLSQAMVSLYSGKIDEALGYFARSLKADPGNPETLFYKAAALRDANRWPQAERAFEEIITERPNYWPAYNDLGWMLYRQAKYNDAAQVFDTAAIVAPKVAMPLANLASAYYEMGERDKAIDACNRSLRRSPNETAYRLLGDIAFNDRHYLESLDNYQRAAQLDPKYHLIWRNIGDCYAMLGHPPQVMNNYAKAAQLLTEDLLLNPRNGLSWATLAFYHAKIGNKADAAKDLKKADDLGAKDVESQFIVAQALALLGKKDDALNLLLLCMDKGLSPVEVDLALDLKDLRKDPRYLSRIAKLQSQKAYSAA